MAGGMISVPVNAKIEDWRGFVDELQEAFPDELRVKTLKGAYKPATLHVVWKQALIPSYEEAYHVAKGTAENLTDEVLRRQAEEQATKKISNGLAKHREGQG